MMVDCHMMAQSIKAMATAATVNATPNCDSLAGSPRRRKDFMIGLSPRTHESISLSKWFTCPSCERKDDFQVAAPYKHVGKRMAKSSEKLSRL
jgi:hypothetical protein